MSFEETLQRKQSEAEKILLDFLPAEEGFPRLLAEAINYSMKAGGKRIRPLLMREACCLCGPESRTLHHFMAALEMIHTHSLIHDDLPALDNDRYRRGKLTTHAVYGEAFGVLSGDALLNYAYETAIGSFALQGTEGEPSSDRVITALRILAEKTGIHGMLGGQSVDVRNEKQEKTVLGKEELDYIYLHKTSALLEAALMVGSVLGGADDTVTAVMEKVGRKIGLAFQIRDDILDVTSTTDQLGKPVHSDEKNQKTTYVTLFGIDGAEQIVQEYTEEAAALLTRLPGDSAFLKEMLLRMAVRKK